MGERSEGPGGAQLRIGELSRRSEVSVRNIREYQDRGLLPPPRREGRAALYAEDHLVRLRLISRLLARGYTLAVIRDLLDAWAGGRDLTDVLGLEAVVAQPWGDPDGEVTLTRAELDELFRGELGEAGLQLLIGAGVFVPDGEGYRCPRRRLIDAIRVLMDARIPADASAAVVARIRTHLDGVATDMVALVMAALLPEDAPHGLPEGEALAGMAASVEHLRAAADIVAASVFGLAMQDAIDHAVDLVSGRALRDHDRTVRRTGSAGRS